MVVKRYEPQHQLPSAAAQTSLGQAVSDCGRASGASLSLAKRFVAANAKRLRLIILPGYCPELNPDELLNQDVKTNALGKSRPTNRAEMMATLRGHLHRRQKQPALIQNLFQEKHVRYAAR